MVKTAEVYTQLFMSLSASFWPVEVYDRVAMIAAGIPAAVDTPGA